MNLEHESLAVLALDSRGYNELAQRLDDNGVSALNESEIRTVIYTLREWSRYLDGDVEGAKTSFKEEL